VLPKRLDADAYLCERCNAALPKHEFVNIDWRGGSGGEPRYRVLCGPCQVDADDGFGTVPEDSAWTRATREVERRYGIPSGEWLATASPLAVLWLRLAQQYGAEHYGHLPPKIVNRLVGKSQVTVADAERLCAMRGFERVDQPHSEDSNDKWVA
jgi:hypothetical protein